MATHMYIRFEEPSVTGTAGGDHANEIAVLSWNHGFVQPATPTSGATRAAHQNLTFTKYLDGASTELLKYCWTAKEFAKVTLSCFRASGSDDHRNTLYLRVVLRHVIIADYHVAGGPGDVPTENVSLDYGTIQYEYIPDAHGAAAASVVSAKRGENDEVVQ